MATPNYLSFLCHRGLDEVHKAGAEFSARWSMPAGHAAFVFAMALGFMGVVMLQAIATLVFNVIWWKSKQ